MRLDVETLIYLYLFICIALLIFNILYIFTSKGREKHQKKTERFWEQEILQQISLLKKEGQINPLHQKKIESSLRNTQNLVAFGSALERVKKQDPEGLLSYGEFSLRSIQAIASRYKKKESMERAYFAYLVSQYPPCGDQQYPPLIEILISFLEDSTVYCKENVLKALYTLGNIQAVENALQVFQNQGWFHHQKLLADGLLTFTGDKEALAERLWSHYKDWNEVLMLSVIQFITGFSENYKEEFMPLLSQEETGMEIRLAILRYYRRHRYEPVYPLLLQYVREEEEPDTVKIVAAFVLARYPGKDTIEVLKKALSHPNWYVRYNAADSLVTMGVSEEGLQDIFAGDDRYAKEILRYKLEEKKAGDVVL